MSIGALVVKNGPKGALVAGVVAALCLTAMGGCQTTFERREFVGAWRLSEESRSLLAKSFSALNPRLELKDDGTFVANEVPMSSFFFKGRWQEFVMRGNGAWELGTHQNRPVVHLHFRELDNYTYERTPDDPEGGSDYAFYVYVHRNKSDFYLYYYDGDPDMGRELRFRKAGA